MRIRQRKVPFPLSSLSPVPLSDPHLISPSPVVVQLNDAMPPKPPTPQPQQHTFFDHQPSPIGKQTDGSDSSASYSGVQIQEQKKMKKEEEDCLKLLQKEEVEEDGGDREKNNDTRKGSIFGSETVTEVVFPPSSPSNQVDGRWCEGEKAIPLKKRRGSYERRVLCDDATENNNNNNNNNNNKKMKTRMKTKMNKKCSTQNHNEQDYDDDDDDEEEEYEVVERKPEPVVGKKRARGSALMEGSRCSRVNGRGWRCCQQTLVGYSLCEHHLGKGRLRSMTSVRSRSAASSSTAPNKNELAKPVLPASLEKQTKCDPLGNFNGEDKDEKKPLVMTTKKRMKLGIVKARSISSLLGQTNTEVAVVENNK